MADTIWTQIMDYIEESLNQISVANGYNHDVEEEGVARWRAFWGKNWPEINLVDAAESSENHLRTDVWQVTRAVEIEMVDTVESDIRSNDISRKFENMKADIFKAVYRDHTQGSNAIDTDYVGCAPVVYEDDNTLIGCAVVFSIRYRFVYDDLTRKT